MAVEEMEHNYVIIYDISDDKRLRHVAKLMESYGIRVQRSIFESKLNSTRLRELKQKILNEITEEEDGVKFFELCPKCWQKTNCIGDQFETDLFKPLMII